MNLNDIINTLKHDGSNPDINKEAIVKALEEIQKEALPTIAAGDAGKVLTVNSDSDGTEWAPVSGGTKLYKHEIEVEDVYVSETGEIIIPHANYVLAVISTKNTAYTKNEIIGLLGGLGNAIFRDVRYNDNPYTGTNHTMVLLNAGINGFVMLRATDNAIIRLNFSSYGEEQIHIDGNVDDVFTAF